MNRKQLCFLEELQNISLNPHQIQRTFTKTLIKIVSGPNYLLLTAKFLHPTINSPHSILLRSPHSRFIQFFSMSLLSSPIKLETPIYNCNLQWHELSVAVEKETFQNSWASPKANETSCLKVAAAAKSVKENRFREVSISKFKWFLNDFFFTSNESESVWVCKKFFGIKCQTNHYQCIASGREQKNSTHERERERERERAGEIERKL